MRNDLLFGILITLLNEGKCTTPYLARKFEVSPKTVQRYLLALEMSGIPTYSELGRHGGTRIVGSFSVDNLFFSKQELSRLFLHLESSPLKGFDSIDQQISEKINFQLKDKMKSEPTQSSIYIDKTCWYEEPSTRQYINNIQTAIKNNLDIKISYNSTTSGYTERTISPSLIINKECKWYIAGYCHKAKELRLFKVSRILSLEICEKAPDTPAISREAAINLVSNSFEKSKIILRTHRNNLTDISQWLEIYELKNKANDFIEIHGNAINNSGLLHRLLCYENQIQIMYPKELRTKLVSICNSITKIYSTN